MGFDWVGTIWNQKYFQGYFVQLNTLLRKDPDTDELLDGFLVNPILTLCENIQPEDAMCPNRAVAESFFKTIKYECLNRYSFSNDLQLYSCIEKYINWYHTKRIHFSLDYKTPLEMEMKLTVNKYKKVAWKICTIFCR